MPAFIDLTGQRFGKWLVLSRNDEDDKHGNVRWSCLCDCGKLVTVIGCSLRNGRSASCGCDFQEKMSLLGKRRRLLKPGERVLKALYKNYTNRSKINNREFTLSLDKFKELINSNCYYCGREPSQIISGKRRIERKGGSVNKEYGDLIYNGIDRVDNTEGYTEFNSVPCCKQCNTKKSNIDITWILKILNHPSMHKYTIEILRSLEQND